MRVLSVVGNRPQFIKSAPLSLALRDAGVDEVVLHTGQHYDDEMSRIFFDELGLAEPRYALDLHTADVATMEPGIRAALVRERPDWVLVFGDTNSTLAGARAGVAAAVPVAHVEAGLRSGDWSMPEERTRVEVDRVAELLLCPDERSRETLARERVRGHAEVVGDVMADASRLFAPPVGYLDMTALASQARVIVTDSGGLQKEAYWYGVPCVTARPSTEWVDTVELGANVLVDDDPDRLVEAARNARMPDDP